MGLHLAEAACLMRLFPIKEYPLLNIHHLKGGGGGLGISRRISRKGDGMVRLVTKPTAICHGSKHY